MEGQGHVPQLLNDHSTARKMLDQNILKLESLDAKLQRALGDLTEARAAGDR
jgi:hypothetical protein